jgi:L-alanine-DL-glutamate epimerase-like enolase superfamily enzyme
MKIEEVLVSAYTIPTDAPESDGTLTWDKTTMVLVEVRAGGMTGLGYTYADIGTAAFVRNILVQLVTGHDPMNIPSLWAEMFGQVRNLGQTGIAGMGISAVDNALWDLKAKHWRCRWSLY